MDWLTQAAAQPDSVCHQAALERQGQLTKPPGSLGILEEVAVRMAALQQRSKPSVEKVWVSVFAADHGVAEEGVSAFPQAVTAEMVRNFVNGGAAVNVLARFIGAEFEVIDVGVAFPIDCEGVVEVHAGHGTANFCEQTAMDESQLKLALNAGRAAVTRAIAAKADVFIGGEMGIANTTSATALACALLDIDASELSGAGTGLNGAQITHKAQVIQAALNKHQSSLESPLRILQTLGGFEIAALAGAYIHASQCGLPVLVDGFIATAAALCAIRINPQIKAWLFFAHCSHEQGHKKLLQALDARPLLDLDMRLGEGSGAVAAVPLMQMACRLHNEMATFSDAQITTE